MGRFVKKVAMVTGGGAGIGAASARMFASGGASVLIVDQNPENGARTVQEILDAGGRAHFAAADVSQPAQIAAAVSTAEEIFGGLDLVHANAGVNLTGINLVDNTVEEIERTVSINLLGVLYTCRAVIPLLERGGGGSIVMTASRTGHRAQAKIAVYSATKAGVINLAESLAMECAPAGIRVNAVAPGITMTEFFTNLSADDPLRRYYDYLLPLKRWGRPEDIAQAVAFLSSEEASWITGITLTVDGGLNLRQGDLAVKELMEAVSVAEANSVGRGNS